MASVLISKILDGDIRSNAPLDNVLFFLIRFHTSILKLAKKLPPSLYFDGMDFGLGISTFSAGMKQAAPIKLILEVILQSIYLHDTQSKVTRNQIETLWNQDYEFYEGCFKKKVYDANSFEALFAKIQPVLFPSSSRSGELVHILFDSPIFMDTVGQMSSDLTKLLSCTQEISSTPEFLEDKNGHSLDSSLVLASNSSSSLKIRPQSSYIHPSPATVLNAFEHSLPEDIDLRKFFETERTGDFELEMLLKEEATNIKMMNMETRKILYALLRDVEMMPYGDNVAQVPDHFSKVARLFPNLPKINSSMWIQLVNSVTSNVERWIDYGAPSMINIRSIVSIPAFLDNILVFPNDSREESLLKMGPVAKDFGAENRHLGRVRNILGVQGLALNNALFSSNTIRDIAESRLQFLPPVSFTVVPASVVFESQKGAKSKPVPIAPVTSHASHSTTTAETVSPSLESSQVNSSSSKTPQLQLCKFSILDDRSNWKVSRVMESTTLAHMSIMTHFSPEVLENENISIICRSPEMFVQEETANPSTDGILDGSSASALLGKSRSGGNNTSYVQLITIMICSTIDTENEREYFFTLIAPTIIKAFSSQNILLDFIDFNWGVQSNHTVVERLKAFDIQIKRSDIFMTILGQQLGDRLDSENEEHRPFATLPSKHSQALLKNKNVSLDAISYELEWVFWKIIEANTLNSTITDSLWYVRDKAYSRSVPKSFRDRYTWADVGMERRLDKILSVAEAGDHTRAIREFPCHFSHIENRGAKMGGLDVLGSFIKADLIQSICEVLSRKIHVASNISATLTHGELKMILTPFQGLNWIQNAFSSTLGSNTALERTGFSLQGVLERCINHAEEYFFNSQPLTVLSMTIVGGLGSGKSTILDTICKKMEQSGIIVLRSKSTTWNGMIDSEDMIRKMTRDLRSHLLQRSLKFEIPLDTKELEQTMLNLLNLASVQRRRVAVVIDDVDRLKNAKGRDSIRWLPRVFQVSTGIWENTCWLLSASDSSISGTLKESHPNMEFYHLEPLSDNQLDECSQNVQTNGVELNRKTMASFYKRSSSRNLLHLSMITQEMIFMRSKGVLISDLPSTLEELLDIKLLQFEQHELGTKIKKALCSIYTSRNGLREKEIIGGII